MTAHERRSAEMSIEERVAYLEGRMEDHGRQTGEVQAAVRESRDEMGRRLEAVGTEFAQLRGELAGRFDTVDRQFVELRGAMREQLRWIIGFQFTVLLAVIGAWLNLR